MVAIFDKVTLHKPDGGTVKGIVRKGSRVETDPEVKVFVVKFEDDFYNNMQFRQDSDDGKHRQFGNGIYYVTVDEWQAKKY